MAYRKILAPLMGSASDTCVLKAAFEVATAFGGHVAGVYVRPDPNLSVAFLGEGTSGVVIEQIIDATRESAKRAAAAAKASISQAAKAAGASLQRPSEAMTGVTAAFQVIDGAPEDVVAEEARLSDLCVFDGLGEDGARATRALLESALVNGRAPLLIVPRHAPKTVGAKVAIGWDGGAQAARAVAASIPMLKRAQSVEILNVGHWPADTTKMDRLRDYLRMHGVQPVEHAIHPGSEETGHALLEAARRLGAGLLVVGGYGHSRLREIVLGGVTRHLLANADMPIFTAH